MRRQVRGQLPLARDTRGWWSSAQVQVAQGHSALVWCSSTKTGVRWWVQVLGSWQSWNLCWLGTPFHCYCCWSRSMTKTRAAGYSAWYAMLGNTRLLPLRAVGCNPRSQCLPTNGSTLQQASSTADTLHGDFTGSKNRNLWTKMSLAARLIGLTNNNRCCKHGKRQSGPNNKR